MHDTYFVEHVDSVDDRGKSGLLVHGFVFGRERFVGRRYAESIVAGQEHRFALHTVSGTR